MSTLTDALTYKSVYSEEPTITIPVYDPDFVPLQLLRLKPSSIKDKVDATILRTSTPLFKGWTSGGNSDKPYASTSEFNNESPIIDLPILETPTNGVVRWALDKIGSPYLWGAKGQNGKFDCSGLIHAAYKAQGINVPASTQAWINSNKQKVGSHEGMPGDVIITKSSRSGSGRHAMLITENLGNGRYNVVEAEGRKTGVKSDTYTVDDKLINIYRAKNGGILKAANGVSLANYSPVDVVTTPTNITFDFNSLANFSQTEYLKPERQDLKAKTEKVRALFQGWISGGATDKPYEYDTNDNSTDSVYNYDNTMEDNGINLSLRFINSIHMNEAGTPYGTLSEESLKGKNIGDHKGNKTYGAGLLYDPDSGLLMDTVTKLRGKAWTKEELEDKFVKLLTKNYKDILSKFPGLNSNQIEALVSVKYMHGHIPKSLETAVKSGDAAKIKETWLHKNDNSNKPLFRKGWNKRNMFDYMWFTGKQVDSMYSPEVIKATKEYFGYV